MIYLGADHRGFKLKEKIRDYLLARGYKVADLGTKSEEPVDYPLIAENVARKVAEDLNNRGIILCGSGAGVCIVANKVNGIRAAVVWNEKVAESVRNDDNANVLCLAADHTEIEDIKKIIQVFLSTSFGGSDRYKRRLKQIEDLEKKS